MGIAYAVSADKAAGLDIDRIQKSYLLTAGLKMVGMALLMGVVTVLSDCLHPVSLPESVVI